MKKLTMLMVLLCSVLSVFAADHETESNVAYLKDCNLQVGTDGTIDLYLKSERPIGTVHVIMDMPEGVTINSVVSDGAAVTFNEKENNLLLGKGEPYYSTGKIATLNVTVAADAQLGSQEMVIKEQTIVEPDLTTYILYEVNSELTIQKTAVIDALPEGFAVTASPFVAEDGDVTLNFNYKSSKDIKSLSFDLELPEGIFFIDDAEWETSNVKSALTASCTGNPSISHSLYYPGIPTSAKITIAGTYSNKSKKYINASEQYSPLATISACVLTQHDIDEYEWDSDIMTEGLSTIKLSNIVLEDTDGNQYTGESLASVIYGKPATQEAILYGNYDNATTDAFTSALKNVAFANTTAATFAEGALLEDVILTKDNTNLTLYTRTSENYGTKVLPYDLEEDLNCTLYTVKDISSESIVIEETDFVAANTPCIFKGTITAYGEFVPTLGAIDDQIVGTTTFKGTYETTSIAAGYGYYISSDGKFYNDGATVRPFRGYFEGTVDGAKSFSVLIDTPDGLKDITDQFSKEDIYNLQGIRMNNVQKGINIKGGKKVLVK